MAEFPKQYVELLQPVQFTDLEGRGRIALAALGGGGLQLSLGLRRPDVHEIRMITEQSGISEHNPTDVSLRFAGEDQAEEWLGRGDGRGVMQVRTLGTKALAMWAWVCSEHPVELPQCQSSLSVRLNLSNGDRDGVASLAVEGMLAAAQQKYGASHIGTEVWESDERILHALEGAGAVVVRSHTHERFMPTQYANTGITFDKRLYMVFPSTFTETTEI